MTDEQPTEVSAASVVAQLDTRIVRMPLRDLQLLEENARFMRYEQFQQLVANIKRDGALTSVPLAAQLYEDGTATGRYEVLSGNHRVQAAIEAGVLEADVMLIDQELTREQRVAIQLSHNAIVGEDDPATLKRLFEELDSIDWRDYAGLDDKTLQLLAEIQPVSMSEANLDFQTLTIVFLPDELERLEAIMGQAMTLAKNADTTWVARRDQHAQLTDALADVAAAYDVQNVATGLDLIMALFGRHVDELTEGWWDRESQTTRHTGWVPVTTVTGVYVPPKLAAALKQRIDKMISAHPGMTRVDALERLVLAQPEKQAPEAGDGPLSPEFSGK